MAATAIKSVVALRLLDLRQRARQEPQAAAEQSGLNEVELEVLAAKTGRRLKTVSDVALVLLERHTVGPNLIEQDARQRRQGI